jgi:hypothetical protein
MARLMPELYVYVKAKLPAVLFRQSHGPVID